MDFCSPLPWRLWVSIRDCVVFGNARANPMGPGSISPFCKGGTRGISKIYMVSENQNPPYPPLEKGGNTTNTAFATQSLPGTLLPPGSLGPHFSKSPARHYHQIDYPYQPSSCVKPFSGAVRIWPSGATAPFDREQTIVTSPSIQVRFHSHYKWVNTPGNMVAYNLMRDLSIERVFEDAAPAENPMPAAYGISGQIYRFALEENGAPLTPCMTWKSASGRKILVAFFFENISIIRTPPSLQPIRANSLQQWQSSFHSSQRT